MLPYLTEWYGNPSSTHRFGQESRQAVEEGRHRVAGLLSSANVQEVVLRVGGRNRIMRRFMGVLAVRGAAKARDCHEHKSSTVRCGRRWRCWRKMGFEVVEGWGG